MKVLVVDDDRETRLLVTRALQSAGQVVVAVEGCVDARTAIDEQVFDVLVVDVMLPDGSGVGLCQELRSLEVNTPILMLTALGEVRDRVRGLDAGADDYLAKPFAVSELNARVRALARRGPALRAFVVRFRDIEVDLERRLVTRAGCAVPLTARELAIVEVLARRRGGVVERDELVESVWGEITPAAKASLEVLVGRIRRKFGPGDSPLRTVRGLGYALDLDP